MTVALCRADLPTRHLARRLEQILGPDDGDDQLDARFRAPVRTAHARPLTGHSVLDEVVAVVEGDAPGCSPAQAGTSAAVARCLLSTWPARNGHLDGIPLIVSPGLVPRDTVVTPGALEPDAVVTVLAAISDAVGRMTDAEATYDALHGTYRTRLRSLAPRTEVADRVASLISRRPVLDVRVVSSRLHMTAAAARRLLAELTNEGWLTHRDDIVVEADSAGGPFDSRSPGPIETWVAHDVVHAVTRPFVGARFPPLGLDALTSAAASRVPHSIAASRTSTSSRPPTRADPAPVTLRGAFLAAVSETDDDNLVDVHLRDSGG
jgi:hypothetical protein